MNWTTTGIAGTGPSKRVGACTILSQNADEPLAGTAYTRDRWLLIEHPGPWPSGAVENVLEEKILDAIEARDPGIRVTFVRRPGVRTVERPQVIYIRNGATTATEPHMRRMQIDSYVDLLSLNFPNPTVGELHTTPLFVVCTHGKREICCAEFGRPVVRALDQAGHDVWEITHIGGDRFAAAMIAFPHGYFFGRLNPTTALDAVQAYEDRRLAVTNLRGLSGWPNSAQAAEVEVRTRTGLTGIDEVRIVDVVESESQTEPEQDARATVSLDVRGGTWVVMLVRRDFPEKIVNGCAPTSQPIVRRFWEVVSVRPELVIG